MIILLAFVSASGCKLGLPHLTGGDGSVGSDAANTADAAVSPTDRLVPDEDAAVDSSVHVDAARDADLIDTSLPIDASPPDAGLVCPPTGQIDCTQQIQECTPSPEPSCYIGTVQQAVQKVISDHPTWFEWSDTNTCYIILDVESYMNNVVTNISSHNLCAIRDPNAPGEEVTVKHDIAFSENFDIVASTGCARYGPAIFTGTCAPSWW